MGNTKKSKKMGKRELLWLIVVLVAIVLVLVWVFWITGNRAENNPTEPTQTTEISTMPTVDAVIEDEDVVTLGQGLTIKHIGKYAGIFMEDGSNEVVSDIMMMILENNAHQDLQLARFEVEYSDFTAEFEVTNLPKGERVVLLEKNRHAAVDEKHTYIQEKNVVFFNEAMSLQEDRVEITGGDGYVEVKNISGEEISGEIFVYYKNSATDLLYGGITYRARVEGGLAAGETKRIPTGHYTAKNSRILQVVIGE